MDNLERDEINSLIVRYQCEIESHVILENLCSNGRLNRSKLQRAGIGNKTINAYLTRLRLCLKDYNHE